MTTTEKPQAGERTQRNWHAHNREGAHGWVVAPLHPSGDGSHYAPITHRLTEEDARLIAAAPELLDALRTMVFRMEIELAKRRDAISETANGTLRVKLCDIANKMDAAIEVARAAIAKATA